MRETIILTNKVNAIELCRSLSLYGCPTMGYRVFNAVELAKYALNRSNIVYDKRIINSSEKSSIIFSFINKIDYFRNASYVDACNLAGVFDIIQRSIIEQNILECAKERLLTENFVEKNDAIFKAFNFYLNFLKGNNLTDPWEFVRFALFNASTIDAKFLYMQEFNLSNLELEFLKVLSNDSAQKINFCTLFNHNSSFADNGKVIKAYGAINELEYVIDNIYSNFDIDDCIIVVTDTKKYGQLLYSMAKQYKIPMTFSFGISINNTNPCILLRSLLNWDGPGYNCVDSLYELFNNQALNINLLFSDLGYEGLPDNATIKNISQYCGNLKLSTNKDSNKFKLNNLDNKHEFYSVAVKLSNIFEKGIVPFLKKYTLIRDDSLDDVSLSYIINEIDTFNKYNIDSDFKKAISRIMSHNLGHELSAPGHIHVSTLEQLFSSPRKNVYFCGLSSKEFPGKNKENYLLLDSDLENFDRRILSDNLLLHKIKLFEYATSFLKALSCDQQYLYSYYDLSELKEQNASSVLYKIVDDFDTCKCIDYFDAKISGSRLLLKKYISGTEINYDDTFVQPQVNENLMEKSWSFSAIDTYLSCPRKFYYQYVLKVPQIEDTDPFEVLNAAEIGIIAHEMMKYLSKNNVDKNNFLDLCNNSFNDFLKNKPALIQSKSDNERNDFINMMSSAYDFNASIGNKSILYESNIDAVHEPTGIKLHGFPDRIENDGKHNIVVDFKTGREVRHNNNDPVSCLQVLIYAFLCEKNNLDWKIAKGQFRYLRNSAVVEIKYDQESKNKMDEILTVFSDGIKNNNFERCSKNCNFCSYKDICLFPGESDKEEEA